MADVALQTTYAAGIRKGLEGMPAGTHGYQADSKICETAAGIAFGKVVGQGTDDKGVVIGKGTQALGVSIRDITLVHSGTALDKYSQYENMGVMTDGDIWVKVTGAVVAGDYAVYDDASGALGETAGTGKSTLAGSRYMTSAGAGELAVLRVKTGEGIAA